MTFRPPTTKPKRRRTRQMEGRRAVFTNAALGFATLAAIALLAGVLGSNYYADHGAVIASVNGVGISKDAVRARAAVDLARTDRQLADYDLLRNQGKISSTDLSTVESPLTSAQTPSTVYSNALTELTDEQTIRQYAAKNGVTVSDADVNAQIAKDGTLPELRHVKVIAVQPKITPPAAVATPADQEFAQATAQGYLDSIKDGGKKWDDVYTASIASGTPAASGDLGLTTEDGLNLDADLSAAIFKLQKVNDMTAVFKGSDGIYRFATITSIVPPYVDSGWQDAIASASSGDEYRKAAETEAINTKIQATIEAQYITGKTPSRHVEEIFIGAGYGGAGSGDEAKIRLIIFAPNHDTTQAATLAQTDPAWTAAKQRADDAYAKIQADPTQFTKIAADSTQNDDSYVASVAGDLPWLPSSIFTGDPTQQAGLGMSAVPAEIFGATPPPVGLMAPLLEPNLGWVIADFQGLRAAPDQRIADAQLALATGSDFATVAKQYSESQDALTGGDMGWISKYELATELEQAIFQTPIGGVSRMVSNSDGFYVFKVLAEESRVPDAVTQLKLKKLAFAAWTSDLRDNTNIWTDQAGLTAITPASPTP
jgi:hypothetical protein